ncbi:MAG: hypothetical protein HYX47_13200 [Burkholderiales bacterium]|nr:hypothetical protein [Burkholderiales bacterium]
MQQPTKSLLLPGTRLDAPIFGSETERFSLTDVFGPNFEGAAIMRPIRLESEEVRRLIRRDYLYLARMFHTLTRAREYRGVDHPSLNKIEEAIEEKVKHVRELLVTRTLDLAKRFNQKPDAVVDVIHARPTSYEAPVASPHANSYLDLLLEADMFFTRAKAAWLQNLTKPQDHHGRMREIKKALYAIKIDVTQARTACFKMLNRISSTMDSADPEAANLRKDIQEVATDLLKDAQGDSEVMSNLTVSEGHDLQAVAAAGLVTGATGDPASADAQAAGDSAAPGTNDESGAAGEKPKRVRKAGAGAEQPSDLPA